MAAARERRVLVTFDVRTLPPLLRQWAETDLSHGGVILVSSRRFQPDDVRGLTRALRRLVQAEGDTLEDQVLFLS